MAKKASTRAARRKLGLIWMAIAVVVAGTLLSSEQTRANTQTQVHLSEPGGSGNVRALDLSSFAAASASVANGPFSVEWPGAAGLGQRSLGSSAVTIDPGAEAILIAGKISADGNTLDALIILDWASPSPTPVVSLGLKGSVDVASLNPNWKLPTGSLVLDGGAVVSTGSQNLAAIAGTNTFYGSRANLPAGMELSGKVSVSDLLPGFAAGNYSVTVTGSLEADITALLTNATHAPREPAAVKFTAQLDASKLSLPTPVGVSAASFGLELGLEGPPGEESLVAHAIGNLTIDNKAVAAAPVTFSTSVTSNGTESTLSGGLAEGSTWRDPFGADGIIVQEANAQLELPTNGDTPTLTLAGRVELAGRRFQVKVKANDELEVELAVGELSVSDAISVFKALGADVGSLASLDAELGSLSIGPTSLGFVTKAGTISGAIDTAVSFRNKSARVLIAGNTSAGGNLIVAIQLPGGKLGDLVPLDAPFDAIPLPQGGVIVSKQATTKAAFTAGGIEDSFFSDMFCDAATLAAACSYDIASGVSLAAQIQLDDSILDLIEAIGPVGTNGTLRVVGTLPVFGGGDLALKVQFPSIKNGAGTNSEWFREARIEVEIALEGRSASFKLVGQIDVALPDEAAPNGVDLVTFQIDAELSFGTDGVSVTIGGGLAPGTTWATPFGVDWLDFEALRIELTVTVTPQPGVQIGVRAKARIGPSTFDASFAIGVSPGKVDFGLRVAADVITLRDVAQLSQKLGAPPLDPSSLPDASLRNVELSFSTIDAPNLCLERGVKISVDVYLDSPMTSAGPGDGNQSITTCGGDTTSAKAGIARCEADSSCLAYLRLDVSDEGIKAAASIPLIDLGAVAVKNASIMLELTVENQLFAIAGTLEIPGFVDVSGSVEISSTGFAFEVTVKEDEPGGNEVSISASAKFGETSEFKFNMFVRLPDANDVFVGIQELLNDVTTAFGGDPNSIYSFRCLEVSAMISSSTTDPISGNVAVRVHFGRLDPDGTTEGRVWQVGWDFDANVASNLTGLIGSLSGNTSQDENGCRIAPTNGKIGILQDGIFSERDVVIINFDDTIRLRAIWDLNDAATYVVEFKGGLGQIPFTHEFAGTQQTVHTTAAVFIDYPRLPWALDGQGQGRYVAEISIRVKGSDTVLDRLTLPVIVTDGDSVNHTVEGLGTYDEGETVTVSSEWSNPFGEPVATSRFFVDDVLVASQTFNVSGTADIKQWPASAKAGHTVSLGSFNNGNTTCCLRELTHELTFGDGSTDVFKGYFEVLDVAPTVTRVAIDGSTAPTVTIDDVASIEVTWTDAANDSPYRIWVAGQSFGPFNVDPTAPGGATRTINVPFETASVSDIDVRLVGAGFGEDARPVSRRVVNPPNNDLPSNDLQFVNTTPSGSTVGATLVNEAPGIFGDLVCGAVWYEVVLPVPSEPLLATIVPFDAHTIEPRADGNTDLELGYAVYDGNELLAFMGADGDRSVTRPNTPISWTAERAKFYQIAVFASDAPADCSQDLTTGGTFKLEATLAPLPPVNDAFVDRIALGLPSDGAIPPFGADELFFGLADLTSAGADASDAGIVPPCFADGTQNTAFFEWTAPAGWGHLVAVQAIGASPGADGRITDAQIAVYEMVGNEPGALVGCAEDGSGSFTQRVGAFLASPPQPNIRMVATPGTTYLIVVDTRGPGSPVAVAVSSFGFFAPLELDGETASASWTTRNAPTADKSILPCGSNDLGGLAWFAWEAPSDAPVEFTFEGDGFSTVGAAIRPVFAASDGPRDLEDVLSGFTEVACNNGATTTGGDAVVAFTPLAGELYMVLASGVDGESGDIRLTLETVGEASVPQVPGPSVPPVSKTSRSGYWMLDIEGRIYGFGDGEAIVPTGTRAPLGSPAVKVLENPSGVGLWVLEQNGTIHALGGAPHHGNVDLSQLAAGEVPATMAATPGGQGYYVFTNRGRALTFGNAEFYSDIVDLGLADVLGGPIVDSAALPDGSGYYMVGSDGGIFAFGAATFAGSVPQVVPGMLDSPVNGIVVDPDGRGYWLVAGDGGVFAFDAAFVGSIPGVLPGVTLDAAVNGMVPYGNGYLMVASDGGIFNFSNQEFLGSLGGQTIPGVIVGVAPVAG